MVFTQNSQSVILLIVLKDSFQAFFFYRLFENIYYLCLLLLVISEDLDFFKTRMPIMYST